MSKQLSFEIGDEVHFEIARNCFQVGIVIIPRNDKGGVDVAVGDKVYALGKYHLVVKNRPNR